MESQSVVNLHRKPVSRVLLMGRRFVILAVSSDSEVIELVAIKWESTLMPGMGFGLIPSPTK